MSKLNELIVSDVEFFGMLEGPPVIADLEFDIQNELMAAYVGELNHSGTSEIWIAFAESYIWGHAERIEQLLKSDRGRKWGPCDDPRWGLVAELRSAVQEVCGDAIDAEIEREYNDYCASNGIYSPATSTDPSELIGFRDEG